MTLRVGVRVKVEGRAVAMVIYLPEDVLYDLVVERVQGLDGCNKRNEKGLSDSGNACSVCVWVGACVRAYMNTCLYVCASAFVFE